jgi:hypothetical protein
MIHNILTRIFGFLFNLFLRFCCGTNRLSLTRPDIFDQYVEQGQNIFAFWHSRLFYLVYFYVKYAKCRKIAILVSMSRDGDYGVALARKLCQNYVRGSTSRGGPQAIRNLADRLAEGDNIAITPDGPRGPTRKANDGVIRLAQLTGARIIPVSFQATRKRNLKSWDGFIFVKPFGKVHVAFAEPITIARNLDVKELENCRAKLERTLLDLDSLCERNLGLG